MFIEYIADRTNGVIKLRERYYADARILANVREKNHVLRNDVAERAAMLQVKKCELNADRTQLNEMRWKLGRLRAKAKNLAESELENSNLEQE